MIYIAFLRGINVGGQNKIKMAQLRGTFESMGIPKVKTYIQSGNVLFESDETEQVLRDKIEDAILTDFGFTVSVVIRTAREVAHVLAQCPFSNDAIAKAEASSTGESLYVALLLDEPLQEGVDAITALKSDKETFRLEGRVVYLLFSESIRNSKLANNLHKLGVPATVRNWKTMNKLDEMAKSME
ncbi:DUF1697 domain-containing protein [Thalassobacillus sp. CUG 92003]|uniref:DUF1697 domain-containing protein n=1 Tax=Thalassobacillus sp. CUG 92003 TaxID=2736641 RepID=UPI0015E7A66D|nr:DUF1697 domain-containing protein [Thalassobacillus sp. CUG 92003]